MSAAALIGWLVAVVIAGTPLLRELLRRPVTRQTRKAAPGAFVELADGITHYRWLGADDGPVVVCVHGLTTPSQVWEPLADRLGRQGYRVLVYDLFGRGVSDAPRGRQGPGFFLRQLRGLLDHLELHDDLTLIGYSMGGAIVTAYAAEDDHRLRRLILVAPVGMGQQSDHLTEWATGWPVLGDWLFHMRFPGQMRRLIEAEEARGDPQALAGPLRTTLARRGYVRSVLASHRGIMSTEMKHMHQQIAEAQLPVTAIWGGADDVIPIRAMGTLTQWNRAVEQVVVDEADHRVVYTHATEIAEQIARPMPLAGRALPGD